MAKLSTSLRLARFQHGVVLDKPAVISSSLVRNHLQRYAGTYLNIASAELATFAVVDDGLIMVRQASSMALIPFGTHQFYGEYS